MSRISAIFLCALVLALSSALASPGLVVARSAKAVLAVPGNQDGRYVFRSHLMASSERWYHRLACRAVSNGFQTRRRTLLDVQMFGSRHVPSTDFIGSPQPPLPYRQIVLFLSLVRPQSVFFPRLFIHNGLVVTAESGDRF